MTGSVIYLCTVAAHNSESTDKSFGKNLFGKYESASRI